MIVSTNEPGCVLSRKLIALLEEPRGPCPAGMLSFGERLDALEAEALQQGASVGLLTMIRVAREAVALSERLTVQSRGSQLAS